MNIEVGKSIPSFEVVNEKEEKVSNTTLLGKKYMLVFYPKDDTPGCTAAACSLRDSYADVKSRGYTVYGVSPDGIKSHNKFIDKYSFPFSLLSDPDATMLKEFGLWGKKKFMGREYEGVFRTTVLVNEEGVIQSIIEKVNTKNHSEQVLEIIDGLS